MSYGLPTLEQFKRILTMLKWWESQPRNKVNLGEWTPLVKRTASGTLTSASVSVTFKITTDHTADAVYHAKSFTDVVADVVPSGALAEADIGTIATANDCLVLNLVELGSSQTGHDVTATLNTDHFSLYGFGRVAHINTDGTKIVHALGFFVGCEEGV